MRWPLCSVVLGLSLAVPARAGELPSPTRPSAADPPADAVLAELPFLGSDEPNRIVVDLTPEGSPPLRMLLDTGAADSVLTPGYARKLGISIRREKSTPYRRETRLGRDLQFWVDTRSSDLISRTGWEYGLLGGTFLREYVVELDFAAHRVRFLDPERYQVPVKVEAADEEVLPLEVVGGRPLLEVSIAGGRAQLLLDTGDWNTGILSGAVARAVGLDSALLPGMRAGSVRGPIRVEFAEVASLRLGRFELNGVPLMVAPEGWYNMAGPTDSAMGYDLLSQFEVRIDYPRQRLWLRRRKDVALTYGGVPYAAERRAGLLVQPTRRGLAVAGLLPDSPAARLGIQPDDVLMPLAGARGPGFEAVTLDAISNERAVTVSRMRHGAWVDVALPAPPDDLSSDEATR